MPGIDPTARARSLTRLLGEFSWPKVQIYDMVCQTGGCFGTLATVVAPSRLRPVKVV